MVLSDLSLSLVRFSTFFLYRFELTLLTRADGTHTRVLFRGYEHGAHTLSTIDSGTREML